MLFRYQDSSPNSTSRVATVTEILGKKILNNPALLIFPRIGMGAGTLIVCWRNP